MKYLLFLCLLFPHLLNANTSGDSISYNNYPQTTEGLKFSYKSLIVPTLLIGGGIYGTLNGHLDHDIQNEVMSHNHKSTNIDNVLMLLPGATPYILGWAGVKGKHNFIDKSIIGLTSGVLAMGTVYSLKGICNVTRPDGSDNSSFPSAHTAVAFLGAEFLYQEYKDKSIWYGIAGYSIAACTGYLRIYNNKHWFSDVLAGAGIGILSTKAAYWLYPEIRKLYTGTALDHTFISPFASPDNGFGLSFTTQF